jgi:hypothetical protein
MLLMLPILFPGCIRVGSSMNGSGDIIDQDMKVTDFNSVNVQGPFSLEINQAEFFKVTLSTDKNLINRIHVSLERKILKVRIEAPATFFPTSLKINIAMPEISSLSLSLGGKATISGFFTKSEFTLFLTEASTLNGNLLAGTANFNLSKASKVSLAGEALQFNLECSGGSKVDLGDFMSVSADANLKEASEATLNVRKTFKVVLSEASKIYYVGNPLISDSSITGGSSMIQQ